MKYVTCRVGSHKSVTQSHALTLGQDNMCTYDTSRQNRHMAAPAKGFSRMSSMFKAAHSVWCVSNPSEGAEAINSMPSWTTALPL